jgi:protease-4
MKESWQENGNQGKDRSAFEQTLVSQLAREFLHEQRRSRRWSIFFKFLLALYVLGFFLIYAAGDSALGMKAFPGKQHTALVDIDGVIAPDTDASADYIVSGLRAAFEDRHTAAVIVRINSPGGSPVQAGYVYDEIRRLRSEHPEIPVYAVIRDLCASGGYYIAAAADEIYADKASIVGSIGVIMSGFGFVDAMDKLGIERRLRHAGEHKGFLDPFSPLRDEDVEHVDALLDDIYGQFVKIVRQGRGERLKDESVVFSGLVWTGEQSLELGLVDGLGSASFVAREVIGVEDIVNFTRRTTFIDRVARGLGAAFTDTLRPRHQILLH